MSRSIDYSHEEEEEEVMFPFQVGDHIRDTSLGGRYLTITDILGQGAYAVVYKVKDSKTGKVNALKCLPKRYLSWHQVNLQREEAKIQKSLSHSNVVRLERYFENKEWLFMVLECCSGSDLFSWITEKQDEFDSHGRRRSPTERRKIIKNVFKQILTAVSYCHSRSVFHRDLKPENLLVTPEGVVKLCDFGLASTEDESEDFDTGSQPYMSYECRNELDATFSSRKADVWSLGILLLSILYRRTPWAEAVPESNRSFNCFLDSPFSYLYHEFGCEYDLADFLVRRVLCPEEQRISCSDWLRLWAEDVVFPAAPVERRSSPLRPNTSRLRALLTEINQQESTLQRKKSWSEEEDVMDFSAPIVFGEEDATDVEDAQLAVPIPQVVSTSLGTMVGTPPLLTPPLIKRFSFVEEEEEEEEEELFFAMDDGCC